MNFPPAGTKCADCGKCEAAIYADGSPICWHCDAGEPCPSPRSLSAAPSVPAKVLQEETTMEKQSKRGVRISEDVRAAILKADPGISHETLARQFNISGVSVGAIRKQAGIVRSKVAKKKSTRKLPKEVGANDIAFRQPAAPPVQTEHVPSSDADGAILISLSDAQLNAIFALLNPAAKARALMTGIRAHTEGA